MSQACWHGGYDHNGNLHQKVEGTTTWDYEWTVENQLERVKKDGAEVATFRYDPLGRRAEKIACGKTYRYLYDGMDILRETITNTTGGTAVATYRYTHGPGIDEPLSRENLTTGAVEYYHADGLGSIVKMTDAAGGVTQTRQYDGWGNLEAGAGQPGFAYTGREWDQETGLYYYRARYFDPKIGRFLSEDPIRFNGGINFYAYVDNNPVRSTDPTGLLVRGLSSYYDGWKDFEEAGDVFPNVGDWTRDRERHCYFQCISYRHNLKKILNYTPIGATNFARPALWEAFRLAVKAVKGDLDNAWGDAGADLNGMLGGPMFWKSCEEICSTAWCRRPRRE